MKIKIIATIKLFTIPFHYGQTAVPKITKMFIIYPHKSQKYQQQEMRLFDKDFETPTNLQEAKYTTSHSLHVGWCGFELNATILRSWEKETKKEYIQC